MKLLARDKLDEAGFFLGELKEVDPKAPEFRFYFSALVTATRSVTLVLQADLRRTHHRGEFNQWWEERRITLGKGKLDFQTLKDLRNAILKEGNLLPLRVMVAEMEEGVVDHVRVALQPGAGKGGWKSISISFRPESVPGFEIIEGESEEEHDRRYWEYLFEVLSQGLAEVGPSPEFEFDGFELEDGASPLKPGDLFALFEESHAELEDLLAEAEALFPLRDPLEEG